APMAASLEPHAPRGLQGLHEFFGVRDFAAPRMKDVEISGSGIAKPLQAGIGLIVVFGIAGGWDDDDRGVRSASQLDKSLQDDSGFLGTPADKKTPVFGADVLTVDDSREERKGDPG